MKNEYIQGGFYEEELQKVKYLVHKKNLKQKETKSMLNDQDLIIFIKLSPFSKSPLKCIETKHKLYIKMVKNPQTTESALQFKNERNRLNDILDKAYVIYNKSKIDKNMNKSEKLWNSVKQIINKNNTQHKTTRCKRNCSHIFYPLRQYRQKNGELYTA